MLALVLVLWCCFHASVLGTGISNPINVSANFISVTGDGWISFTISFVANTSDPFGSVARLCYAICDSGVQFVLSDSFPPASLNSPLTTVPLLNYLSSTNAGTNCTLTTSTRHSADSGGGCYLAGQNIVNVQVARKHDAPSNFVATISQVGTNPNRFNATLKWDNITVYGWPLYGYWVTYSNSTTSGTWNTTATQVSLIVNIETEYTFTVRALSYIDGYTSTSIQTFTWQPEMPSNVQCAIVSSTRFNISWDPAYPNGSPVLSYSMYCGTVPLPDTFLAASYGNVTSIQQNGETGKNYTCKITATNSRGDSPVASITCDPLITAPDAPTLISVSQVTDKDVEFKWLVPNENGASITSYTVYHNGTKIILSSSNYTLVDDSTRKAFINLTTETRYRLQISANNSQGEGPKSESQDIFLYGPPTTSYDQITVNACVDTVPTNTGVTFNLCSTSGGQTMFINGSYLDRFGNPSVSYTNGNLTYICNVSQPNSNSTFINCTLSPGVGRGFNLTIMSGPVLVPVQNLTINYPLPNITKNTLHREGSNPVNPLTAQSATASDTVSFDGFNFGIELDKVMVSYGSFPSFNDFSCSLKSLNDTNVVCSTEGGQTGRNLQFKITVGGQSANGSDIYNYLANINVTSITGCITNNGTLTSNCPTNGNVNLTLTGEYLTPPLTITIGGRECTNVSYLLDGSSVNCTLSAGAGLLQAVVVISGDRRLVMSVYVSYAVPQINGLIGCNSTTNVSVVGDCPRNGSAVLTVLGNNFGVKGARVFVGGTLCPNTTHAVGNEHNEVYCAMPPGQGKENTILVYQLEGEIGLNPEITVSYAPCPAGTNYIPNNITCVPCDIGHANNLTDRSFCPACEPGFWSNLTGLLECNKTPNGFFSNTSGATSYFECPLGKQSDKGEDNNGFIQCVNCFQGFFGNESGCQRCPEGSFTNETGRTNCTPCAAGYYAPSTASNLCFECLQGRFSEAGAKICGDCLAGKFSGLHAGQCSICPVGTSSGNLSAECTVCGQGQYSNDPLGASDCIACSPGQFNNATNQSACMNCSAGSASKMGAFTCSLCDPGYYSGVGATGCTPCEVGKANSQSNQSSCRDCPPGSSSTQGIICEVCGQGKYNNASGKPCLPCPGGKYSAPNATACQECLAGKYAPPPTTGPDAVGAAVCISCPNLTSYSPNNGSDHCIACPDPPNYERRGDDTFCTRICKAGSEDNGAQCVACPAGRYKSINATIPCGPCGDGQVQAINGSWVPSGGQSCVNGYAQTQNSKIAFIVLSSLGLASVVAVAIAFLVIFVKHPVVHRAGRIFTILTLIGFLFLYSSVILWVLDSTPGICVAKHWVLNLGFTCVLFTLTLKTYYLDRVFNNPKLQVVNITNKSLLIAFAIAISIDLVILIIWTGAAPSTVEPGILRCDSKGIPAVIIVQWLLKSGIALALLILTFRVRQIDKRFRESYWLAAGLYNIILVCIALLALSLAANLTPRDWVLLFCAVQFYLTTTLFFLIFFPKFREMYRHDTDFFRNVGMDDMDEALKDAKSVASATTPDLSSRSTIGGKKNNKDIVLTESEATEQQLIKTKADLEKLLRHMDKEKEDLKKELTNVNKLKEQLVHLTERKEFLLANPDQGKATATRVPQDSVASVDSREASLSNMPPSPSADNTRRDTEMALIGGKEKQSSSVVDNGSLGAIPDAEIVEEHDGDGI